MESATGGGGALAIWSAFEAAWASGGLAFLLFLVVIALGTGRVFTAQQRDSLIAQWKERYEENDKRWKERYDEVKARAEASDRMVQQVMGWNQRVTTVAERVAERVPLPGQGSS